MFLVDLLESSAVVAYTDGEFRIERDYEVSMGVNPKRVWELYYGDTYLGQFPSRKIAVLGIDMIQDGKIENTMGKGDLGMRMNQWFHDNGQDSPRGLGW